MIGAVAEHGLPVRTGALGTIDLLLRDRKAMHARIETGADLPAILKTMTATIAVSMLIVGAALGTYRGHEQILYAAIKLPLVLLGTAALSAPALSAIGAALGRPTRLANDLALVMTALAFGSLLLAACTPLIMLAHAMHLDYHRMILGTVGMFSVAGLCALQFVCRGVARTAGPGWRTAIAGLCIVFSLVGGQLAWALRPYLVRPRAEAPVFVHDIEGSLLDAISQTFDSARGIYSEDSR